MHITLNQADQYIRWFDEEELSDLGADMPARLVVTDTTTGEAQAVDCTATQFAAVMFLALVGEDAGPKITELMYEIAEPAVTALPNNLRPIP